MQSKNNNELLLRIYYLLLEAKKQQKWKNERQSTKSIEKAINLIKKNL
tara:strand:+ start:523 stop:666 length:144 start_codon:yes stop_codon:yes gene_type:complete